jgi:GNAT superfamily N-acetyltransferase
LSKLVGPLVKSQDPIQIRVATLRDLEAVRDVYLASYPVLMAGYYPDEALQATLPGMTRPWPDLLSSGRFFVVESRGQLDAVGGWSPHPPGRNAGPAHVRHFATRPSAARQGFGGALLRHCIAQARASSQTELHCFSSLNAESFYAAHGFRPAGYREISVGGHLFAVVEMKRRL